MNLLDAILVVSALSFAYSGYRQGFVVGVLSFGGFLGGAVVGMLLAPSIVDRTGSSGSSGGRLVALAVVLVVSVIGQVLGGWLGNALRGRLRWAPARTGDAALGALVSVTAMLLVSWFMASALRPGPVEALSRQISDSRVLAAVDTVMPEQASTLFSTFRQVLDDNGLPTVFGGISAERIRPVDPPSSGVTGGAGVRAAAAGVIEIDGTADSCGRRLEGSGFVVAREHVLTNAHVVAGVRAPRVQVGGLGRRYDATVVAFDAGRDVAVLYVPGLRSAPLRLAGAPGRGAEAVVAGFPGGGPYRLAPARVRDTIRARGPDIYDRRQITREVFSLYADVEPGNSGGPLLSPQGDVYGVVFAKSLDDPTTGYALTAAEVAPVIAAGRTARARVDTGACT